MKILKLAISIIFKEGLINYIKRKRNITFLDSKTVYTINYKEKKTKIILNRKFGLVDMMIFRDGIYEKEIIDGLYEELTPEKNFIDIGANIGQHSLLLAPYCKKIYSFEPIPEVFGQFKKSIELNNIKNIFVYNYAIGKSKDIVSFNYVSTHAGTSSFIERDDSNCITIAVKIETLENLIGKNKMDVVKLDVEGYEAVVILGNKQKFLKDRPVIFMEFSPSWIEKEQNFSPEDLISFFLENNFEIYSRKNRLKLTNLNQFNLKSQDNWIVRPKA